MCKGKKEKEIIDFRIDEKNNILYNVIFYLMACRFDFLIFN